MFLASKPSPREDVPAVVQQSPVPTLVVKQHGERMGSRQGLLEGLHEDQKHLVTS
jgi:hypothetical protein